VQFVRVENGVQLEVLDWGGSGRPLVLLAGSGNSAHVFDDFAIKLRRLGHVYGITRRGYGASSRPESGFSAERLADDVLVVLDSLHLATPVLVGHSLGGHELTALASSHPSRIAGLVYMDSTADPTFDWNPYEETRKTLPAAMNPLPLRSDLRSIQAYRDWQRLNLGVAFPEAELRNTVTENPDGSMGRSTTPHGMQDEIFRGMRKPDYSRVRVPVLAFVVLPTPISEQLQRYHPKDADERDAVEKVYLTEVAFAERAIGILNDGVPGARVVRLTDARHHVFLSNEGDVLQEIRAFLVTLH
jgi:pimeloyl-ACP methyl ester carboxylesterase